MASSSYIKGITVRIEGDTGDLAKSLDSVNKDIKNTSRALKDVEKALELDPGNLELIAQKQELLNKQIEQTSQKLELEQQVAEQAKEALEIGTITQEEYASLSAEVATTASELESLEGAADSSAGSIEDTGAAAEEAGSQAEESGDSFVNWGDVVAGAAEVAAGALAAVGTAVGAMGAAVVEGTKELVNSAKDMSESADVIDKQSQKVGLSTDAYQKWDYVMNLAGTSMSNMGTGLKTLTNKLDDAKNGSEKSLAMFEQLGLSLDDLNSMSREDVFGAVITGFQNMADSTERAALANDLLGKSGQELTPLFNQTAEATQDLMDKAEEYGIVMSEDLVKDGAAFKDSMTTMNATLEGVKNRVVGQFLPGLTMITDGIAGMAAGVDGADEDIENGIDQMVGVFEELLPTIQSTIETLLPTLLPLGLSILSTIGEGIISQLPVILTFATELMMTLVSALLQPDNLTALLNAAIQILLTLVDGILSAVEMLIDPALQAIDTLVTALLQPDMIEKIINAALRIILTVASGLSKALPRLIPAIVEAINTITVELTKHTDELILAALDIIVALASGLVQALPTIANTIFFQVIPEILKAFGRLGEQLPQKAVQWGEDLIGSLIKGVKSMLGALSSTVSNVAGTIAKFLHFSVPDIGPLSDFDKSGGDMIQEFIKSMQGENPDLKAALYQESAIISGGFKGPNYSGALAGISSQLAGLGAGGSQIIIPVSIGGERLDTIITKTQNNINYRSGGH